MNFVVHFSFVEFVKPLKAGSIAYITAFALPSSIKGEYAGYLLATSDAGIEGGTVQALQIMLSDKAEDSNAALELASQAYITILNFLKRKRVKVVWGILSTAGLHESLRYWNQVTRYSITELKELTKTTKKKEAEGVG